MRDRLKRYGCVATVLVVGVGLIMVIGSHIKVSA